MTEPTDMPAFQPKPTRNESAREITTRVARAIIDGEKASSDEKTERLRAARLARENAAAAIAAARQEQKLKRG